MNQNKHYEFLEKLLEKAKEMAIKSKDPVISSQIKERANY